MSDDEEVSASEEEEEDDEGKEEEDGEPPAEGEEAPAEVESKKAPPPSNDRNALEEMRAKRAQKMAAMFGSKGPQKFSSAKAGDDDEDRVEMLGKLKYRCANWAVPLDAKKTEHPEEWTERQAEDFLKRFLLTGRESSLDYAGKKKLEKQIEWVTRNTTADMRPAIRTALVKTQGTNQAASALASLGFAAKKDWVKNESEEHFKLQHLGIKEAMAENAAKTAALKERGLVKDERFSMLQKMGAESGMLDQFEKKDEDDSDADGDEDGEAEDDEDFAAAVQADGSDADEDDVDDDKEEDPDAAERARLEQRALGT